MYLLSYTRKPIDNVLYDERLAYSCHFAYSDDGKVFYPLNHNSGVLFAKAVENEDGSLDPRTLKKPVISENEFGRFLVSCELCGPEGEDLGKVITYATDDFLEYETVGTESMDIMCEPDFDDYDLSHIEGCVPASVVRVSDVIGDKLKNKLLPITNTDLETPITIKASSPEELNNYRVLARYSDKSTALKNIEWNLHNVDWNKKGAYQVTGFVKVPHFEFPIATDRADPCIGFWKGKYYFIATNDADGNHTLYIREGESVEELVNAPEHLILDSDTYPEIGGLLWAPEFHVINGKLYIFHAATPGPFFEEESCIMELKHGGNPINKDDWTKPRRIVKADGSDLCEAGKEITLDMTEFEWDGEFYVIWSQRQFLPKDLGAWLYIAKLNPDEPYKLASEPVILSKPDYSWANNHTFVEEGPFALKRNDRLFITYSAAAVDTSYVVGLLQIEKGKDLLNPSNWKKRGFPLLTSRSVEGEYGTGHNAFVVDREGYLWNTYHARPGTDAPRSSGIRRVHFDIDDEPVLDMVEERDVAYEFRTFMTTIVVD